MNLDLDHLTETFSAHESLAPDADTVLARSHEIARNLKRRQWAVRATGGAVLGAGLVVGGVAIPRALHHSGNNAVIDPASGGGLPDGAPGYTQEQEFAAYFNAGYDYNDAQQLAQLWHETGVANIGKVKAEAGGKLLAGEMLPVSPSGTPATPQDLALQAFFNAGYDYQDAQQLGQMWHETDISGVKVEAGQKLENGEPLPIEPSGSTDTPVAPDGAPSSGESQAAGAAQTFFDAGYTYDDAIQLAKTWHLKEPYQAKVEGGQKIEKGQTLPIAPSGTPASAAP